MSIAKYVKKYNDGKTYQWHPWFGCHRVSEACQNCYIKFIDNFKIPNGRVIPLPEDINDYETVFISSETDLFLEEGKPYINQVWDIIKQYPSIKFELCTKRPERITESLPEDWGDGWDNVVIMVTMENQKRANERMPILKAIPAKHKWITLTPMLEQINIEKYLKEGWIEEVLCGGEKAKEPRELRYEWVKDMHDQCAKYKVRFLFIMCGFNFIKDGVRYYDYNNCYHSYMADTFELDWVTEEEKKQVEEKLKEEAHIKKLEFLARKNADHIFDLERIEESGTNDEYEVNNAGSISPIKEEIEEENKE